MLLHLTQHHCMWMESCKRLSAGRRTFGVLLSAYRLISAE